MGKLGKICLLLWSTLFIPLVICESEDIIIVKNKTHLMCITDDITSPIYVDPPLTTKSETWDFLQDVFWSDWSIKNSFETMQKHITDKRWEDFAVTENSYNLFKNVSSVSFSIYSPETIEFYIDNSKKLDYHAREVSENSNARWRHYSIVSNTADNTVDIYEDGQIYRSISDFTPQEIVVKTSGKKFWKIHDYTIGMATAISSFPTNFTVPSDIECLTFYVSLCSHCSLFVEVGKDKNYTFSTNHRVHQFSVDSGSDVTLIRDTLNGEDDGLWQIDAWKCPNLKSGKVIYEVTLNETYKRTCRTLTNYNEDKYTRRKRSADEVPLSECNIGWFGKSCDISCENLLGPEKNTCQGHEICEKLSTKMECLCAWGYRGSYCDEQCSSNTWGLTCDKKCSSLCSSCNPITGKCNVTLGNITTILIIVLIVLIISSLIPSLFFLMKYRRKYQRLNTRELDNST